MISEELVKNLAEQQISGTDKFVVNVKIKTGNKIFVFIDADTSVSIGDCAKLSKFIESQFDRDVEDFEIEVSSSGLDFPLQLPRQYKKNIEKNVKVVMKDGTVKKGVLTEVVNDGFVIEETIITKNIKKKKEISKVPVTIGFESVKGTWIIVNI